MERPTTDDLLALARDIEFNRRLAADIRRDWLEQAGAQQRDEQLTLRLKALMARAGDVHRQQIETLESWGRATHGDVAAALFRIAVMLTSSESVTAELCELAGRLQTPPPDTEADLREIQRNILEAADQEFRTAEELSKRAGYKNNSNFRAALALMKDKGLLVSPKNNRGYRRP